MTDRTRRDRAVQYLDGTMTPAERQAFEEELERDDRLRTVLNAETMVAGALQPKAGAPALEHLATRAHVMERLANLPRTAGAAAKVAGAGGLSFTAKIIVGSILGVGALSVGYVAMHNGNGVRQMAPAPAVAPAAPSAADRRSVDSMPAEQPAQTVPAQADGTTAQSGRTSAAQPVQAESTHAKHEGAPAMHAPATRNPVAAQPQPTAPAADRPSQPNAEVPVVHRDNNVHINITVPRDSTSRPKHR
ncbi:MAG TPA: hypothetical protein VHI13_17510 [Candidatus Kapabacteria bacterium]|nr:hypothetical protein [Candidatus Kapabacteria bacterium]